MRWVCLFVASLLVAACSGTTTTVDRLAEIEAIYEDLEERRLEALHRGDREKFSALFANEAYLALSMGAFDVVDFIAEPTAPSVAVLEVLHDDEECLALRLQVDATQSLGPDAIAEVVSVLERDQAGDWGYSFAGPGWLCDGPHPYLKES